MKKNLVFVAVLFLLASSCRKHQASETVEVEIPKPASDSVSAVLIAVNAHEGRTLAAYSSTLHPFWNKAITYLSHNIAVLNDTIFMWSNADASSFNLQTGEVMHKWPWGSYEMGIDVDNGRATNLDYFGTLSSITAKGIRTTLKNFGGERTSSAIFLDSIICFYRHNSIGEVSLNGYHTTRDSVVWSLNFGYNNLNSPTWSARIGKVMVFRSEGQFFAIDLINGKSIWQRSEQDAWSQNLFYNVSQLISKNILYINSRNSEGCQGIEALDVATGKTLWHYFPTGERVTHLADMYTVDNKIGFLTYSLTHQQYFNLLDAKNGTELLRQHMAETTYASQFLSGGGRLYRHLTEETSRLVVYNASDFTKIDSVSISEYARIYLVQPNLQ